MGIICWHCYVIAVFCHHKQKIFLYSSCPALIKWLVMKSGTEIKLNFLLFPYTRFLLLARRADNG